MRRNRFQTLAVLVFALALVAAACAKEEEGGGNGGQTLLDRITADGAVRVATDPAYPPQSSYDKETQTWEGYDIDVATEIADRLGVAIEWETPSWDVLTAGSWNDRWDLSIGSMTPTGERVEVLDFSVPYRVDRAYIAVGSDSGITSFDQLSGKKIGVCGACTYEYYLDRTLVIQAPGFDFEFSVPEDVEIITYDTDSTAIQDLALGRLDAVMSSQGTLQSAIDKGKPMTLIGDPAFFEPVAVAADKSLPLDTTSLTEKVSQIIEEMHSDGTLTELSMKWYDQDISTAGA